MFWVVQLEQSPDAFYCWQRAHTHDDVGASTCVCARVCSECATGGGMEVRIYKFISQGSCGK